MLAGAVNMLLFIFLTVTTFIGNLTAPLNKSKLLDVLSILYSFCYFFSSNSSHRQAMLTSNKPRVASV